MQRQDDVSGGWFIYADENTAVLVGLAAAAAFFPVSVFLLKHEAAWAVFLYIAAGVLICFMLNKGFPCKWSADEHGFTIKAGPFRRRMAYGDIQFPDITYQNLVNRKIYRTKAILIIMDTSGKKKTYTEFSKADYYELMRSPDTCPKPQLLLLYELIRKAKETDHEEAQ